MNELSRILENQFQLKTTGDLPDTESAYLELLHKALSARVAYYINTDIEALLQILYRIDIDQSLTDAAFHLGEVKKISEELSKLIIKRQLAKIEYSRNFSQKK